MAHVKTAVPAQAMNAKRIAESVYRLHTWKLRVSAEVRYELAMELSENTLLLR